MHKHIIPICLAALTLSLCSFVRAEQAPLTPQNPVVIPGPAAKFDYMNVDSEKRRLLVAHTAAGSLAIIDLEKSEITAQIPVGTIQGVVVDAADNLYVTGNSADHKVVFVDRDTLKPTGKVETSGPVDDLVMNPANGLIYADHDDGTDVWVIDPKAKKLVGSVTISEAPEYILYDSESNRLYQNIKSNSTLQVIDPAANKVVETWQTAPATSPHGLAIDGKAGRAYSAGNNGKLVVFDIKTGKVITTVDIAKGVDQIAYDAGLKRVYCACRGFVSVVQATSEGAKLLANIVSPAGAHTIAVDPKTHSVWVCYADKQHSYVEEFKTP